MNQSPVRPTHLQRRKPVYQPSEDSQLSREWRAQVMDKLNETADKYERAAVILERVTNLLDEHDKAIKALQEQPEKKHTAFLGNTGVSLNAVYATMSVVSFIAVFVAPHWH